VQFELYTEARAIVAERVSAAGDRREAVAAILRSAMDQAAALRGPDE
jgi:hypothetical protein